jgi:hypothetical protein
LSVVYLGLIWNSNVKDPDGEYGKTSPASSEPVPDGYISADVVGTDDAVKKLSV